MVDIKIYRAYTIQVQQRELIQVPGSAEPKHTYSTLFTTRADVKTRSGEADFAKVSIKGAGGIPVGITHTFSIRYTTIPFDTRHRVRDAQGHLFAIVAVEDVDLANREMRIHCAASGSETVEAAR